MIILAAFLLLPAILLAQEKSLPDSSAVKSALTDSSKVKSDTFKKPSDQGFANSKNDTTQKSHIKISQVGLDSSVVYSARVIDSYKKDGLTYLIGDATIKYKNMKITAARITIRWNDNTIVAESLPDSLRGSLAVSDSSKGNKAGLPVFTDGKEKMVGDKMEFNFKTERGRIIRGRTEFQGGYYVGEAVKRISPDEINIKNGVYSTCENEEPHFHFLGKKMKIISEDKVIAKPVIFFIGKIPLAILPFAFFPSQEDGRQSGLILPQFGTSPVEGRYLQDLGYYWAANDYFDARFTLSFFERTGILFKTSTNYALRYKFTGSVSGSFTRKNFPDGSKQRRWDLRVRHSQTVDENTRFSVNASFVSNNSFYREFSTNRSQRLSRQIVSNATFSKRWGEGKNSLTLNLSQTKDLDTGSNFVTFPQAQFIRSQSAIIPVREDKTARTKAKPKWFNYIRYDYKGLLLNSVSKTSSEDDDPEVVRRAEHDFRLTFTNPNKIFGWLTFNQSVTYDEDWFAKTKTFSFDSTTKTIKTSDKSGFAARHLFQYSASTSTKLYGTFNTGIGPMKALRHVMTPSLSFIYQPDFSSSLWSYYEMVNDSTGKPVKKDRFQGLGARATPAIEQNRLSFSLSNLFQMKWGEGQKEKKIDLFTLNFSSGYNFAAKSFKWQDLSTRFQANPKKNLSVTMSMSHSFYEFDREINQRVDKLLFETRGLFNFLRLTQFNLTSRWTLSGKQKSSTPQNPSGSPGSGEQNLPNVPIQVVPESQRPFGTGGEDRFGPESAFSAFDIPWRATLSFSYSVNKFNPANPSRNAYIDLSNVEVQLTKNWRIGYRIRYNFEKEEVVDQRISFYRDLHCWEAQFNWTPSGFSKGFYFRIGIKAPHLRDIKFEQRGGSSSIFRPL